MMSLRINLLREEEQRYAGAVSKKFAVRASIALVAGLVVITLTALGLRSASARMELASLRRRLRDLDPRHQELLAVRRALQADRQLVNELRSWGDARINWARALHLLQRQVPDRMQLTLLAVQGSFEMTGRPPARDDDPPQIPARRFSMRLEGRVMGDMADEVVVAFISELRDDEFFRDVLESVKLQRLERERVSHDQGGEPRRMFALELNAKPRLMP